MKELEDLSFKKMKEFGGTLHKKSHPKFTRPLSFKRPVHLILKSSVARGDYSMRSLKNLRTVERIVRGQARRFSIRLLEYANEGQHLHIIGQVKNRDSYLSFIRASSGLIARHCLSAQKGHAKKVKFWDFRPYSRIVERARTYKLAQDGPLLFHLQALGMIPFAPLKPKWNSA